MTSERAPISSVLCATVSAAPKTSSMFSSVYDPWCPVYSSMYRIPWAPSALRTSTPVYTTSLIWSQPKLSEKYFIRPHWCASCTSTSAPVEPNSLVNTLRDSCHWLYLTLFFSDPLWHVNSTASSPISIGCSNFSLFHSSRLQQRGY